MSGTGSDPYQCPRARGAGVPLLARPRPSRASRPRSSGTAVDPSGTRAARSPAQRVRIMHRRGSLEQGPRAARLASGGALLSSPEADR
eukprot:8911427-Pyramimonas_sp.AAC.1